MVINITSSVFGISTGEKTFKYAASKSFFLQMLASERLIDWHVFGRVRQFDPLQLGQMLGPLPALKTNELKRAVKESCA